ncbi:UvrD-helicase domain-containing protein (plasmid) [Streptomyces atratus]|uniref:UvrD/REP helicase N-terminal domain-containing protein n=1 Tax=Streptomyces atratus TaxID=1893 RepID=A0A1K1ZN61_STRAR|nr:UvrD-helicase domain-containing protein [Streptomyces atratus]SFX75527.1 UvrD/REP helicase N-terminal domain-containing protein [Streptomyces atratus]
MEPTKEQQAAREVFASGRDLALVAGATHAARLVMGMVRKFCYTTDRQVMARHMEPVNGLDGPGQDYLARTLLPYAHRAWEDICLPAGRLRFEHDHCMKLWAMTSPQLGADFVLLDEAQDTNPVLEEVFLAQDAQRVCVGDPAQQIYGWRNARDVMTGFPAEQLRLTQSFRFGPAIAEVANRWLGHAESEMHLTGHGPGSRVGEVAQPETVRSSPAAATSAAPTPTTSSAASCWTAKPPRTPAAWAAKRSISSPDTSCSTTTTSSASTRWACTSPDRAA